MLEVYQREAPVDASEFVRAWALADGTRCVLAVIGPALELRVVSDDRIGRRAQFSEMQDALDAAQLWRIECRMGSGLEDLSGAALLCPECAEYVLAANASEDGRRWYCCPHCGHSWHEP